MATDWLKVCKDTPDKPEIAIVAKILGVERSDAFMEWFRLYAWADGMTTTGRIVGVRPEDVDILAHCRPGTCAAFSSENVEWIRPIKGDFANGIFFAHWDRHNGKCSKARALDTEKKRRQRGKSVPNVTGQNRDGREKRRRDVTLSETSNEVSSSGVDSSESLATAEQPLLDFPVVGKGGNLWSLTAHQVHELSAAFPGIDVVAEARKALVWCEANPTRQKTVRGMSAFLFRWMERAQNGGGSYEPKHGVRHEARGAYDSRRTDQPGKPAF